MSSGSRCSPGREKEGILSAHVSRTMLQTPKCTALHREKAGVTMLVPCSLAICDLMLVGIRSRVYSSCKLSLPKSVHSCRTRGAFFMYKVQAPTNPFGEVPHLRRPRPTIITVSESASTLKNPNTHGYGTCIRFKLNTFTTFPSGLTTSHLSGGRRNFLCVAHQALTLRQLTATAPHPFPLVSIAEPSTSEKGIYGRSMIKMLAR